MNITKEVSTKWINQYDEGSPPKSKIILNGSSTEKIIPGAKLEAAIAWNHHYLLFMTDDCPYEEGLTIIMLDKNLVELDIAYLGAAYASGEFSSLKLLPPDRVEFVFFNERTLTIQLFNKCRPAIPFIGESFGVIWRSRRFFRRFKIHVCPENSKWR